MRRLGLGVGIALAVLLTAQLVVHNHSLVPERVAPPCSICAFGADQTVAAPSISTPLVLAYEVPADIDEPAVAAAPSTSSSRAPPRA